MKMFRLAAALAALTLAASGTVLGLGPAAYAASPCSPVSCVYNYSGSGFTVPCVQTSGCPTGTSAFLPNGKQVGMACWFDYAGLRWFEIRTVPLAGTWVIPANYVFNQVSVGSC